MGAVHHRAGNSRRVIYVAGTASSGSSCLAGVLHRLGVNMGRFMDRTGIRGYTTYEDTWTDRFKYVKPGDSPLGVRQRLRFREYLTFRLQQDGRQGCKGAPLWWLDDPEPETLPIDLVLIERPLKDSIRSDWRIQQYIHETRPDKRPRPLNIADKIHRAQEIGATWAGAQALSALIRPALRLEFYALLREPSLQITSLTMALGLEVTPEQVGSALAFIDPKMRHV